MKKLGLVFVLLCGGVFWAEAFGQTERIEELYLPKEDGKIIYQKVPVRYFFCYKLLFKSKDLLHFHYKM